jgi:hypothetical protein
MASACLFLGFDRPHPGKEDEARKFLMNDATETLQRYQREGYFESFQLVALTPHCSDLNLFFVLNGDRAKLDELRRTDDFEKLSMRLMSHWTGYGVIPGVTDDGLRKVSDRNPNMFK